MYQKFQKGDYQNLIPCKEFFLEKQLIKIRKNLPTLFDLPKQLIFRKISWDFLVPNRHFYNDGKQAFYTKCFVSFVKKLWNLRDSGLRVWFSISWASEQSSAEIAGQSSGEIAGQQVSSLHEFLERNDAYKLLSCCCLLVYWLISAFRKEPSDLIFILRHT